MTITEQDLQIELNEPNRSIVVLYDSSLDSERHPFIRAVEYSKKGYSLDKGWGVPDIGDIYYFEKPKTVKATRVRSDDDSDIVGGARVSKPKKVNSYTKRLDISLDELEI